MKNFSRDFGSAKSFKWTLRIANCNQYTKHILYVTECIKEKIVHMYVCVHAVKIHKLKCKEKNGNTKRIKKSGSHSKYL